MIAHDAPGSQRHPYPGAAPFQADDAPVFFGRAEESRELIRSWSRFPLTILSGDTGSGKTSLLQAGALPGFPHARVGRVGRLTGGPIAALPPSHNPWTLSLLTALAPLEPVGVLAGMSLTDYVTRLLRRRPGPVLVAVDQFEEFFLGGPYRAHFQEPFVEELLDALDSHPELRVLLVVRESRRDDLNRYDALVSRAEWLTLGPLGAEAALEAICRPAEGTARRFTEGAAAQVLDVLGGNAVEPVVLQIVCQWLWTRLPPTLQLIRPEHVFRLADSGNALAQFLSDVLAEVGGAFGQDPASLHAWAVAAFADGHSVKQGTAETAGMRNSIVHALEDRHLLRSVLGDGMRLLHDDFRSVLTRLKPITAPGTTASVESAVTALSSGDLDGAEEQAFNALEVAEATSVAEIHTLLGDIQIERARAVQAVLPEMGSPSERAHQEEVTRQHLDKALSWYRLGLQCHADLGDSAAAGRMLSAIGQVMAQMGELSSAVRNFEEAKSLLPRDLALRTELARALWLTDRRSRAMTELDSVLRDEGDQLTALRARGEFNAEQGRAEAAMRDLRRVSSRTWPATRAARALALATLEQLGPGEAEREVDAIVADGPTNGPALLYAARVETLSGDFDKAAELARQAIVATGPPLSPQQKESARRLLDRGHDR
ncbi:tetratricopeptide repeat protein [Microbispora hainanensis]|uniref:nSTAND1 domain-containing NTPase n=1 Tax=Microbispora hainanensis TaxID=568844 RepID=UPI00340C6CDA